MRRLLLTMVLGTLAVLVSAQSYLLAQDAAPKEADAPAADTGLAEGFTDALSLDAEKPAVQPLDPALFAVPENAAPAEMFAFIDSLEGKLPQPTNEAEMQQLIDALTKCYLDVAEKVLAHPEATKEDKERARQQKLVALSARARSDENAAGELDSFLNEQIAAAEDDAAKSEAYQMKVQALMSDAQRDPAVLEKVAALADKILAEEKAEQLQLLGLELKAQTLLARLQNDPTVADAMLAFLEPMIAAEETAQTVREKAQEIKAVALLIAAETDATKEPAFEGYFDELLAGPLSPESRQRLYQLRVQTLMPAENADEQVAAAKAQKLDALIERLLKEESEDLQSLGYAAKANALLAAAQKDPKEVDKLFAYADERLASAPSEQVKEQMAGLKIQGYMMKKQQGEQVEPEMLAFIDQMIAEKPSETFLGRLATIKIQILSMAVQTDPTQADALAEALNGFAATPGAENLLPLGWANVYMAKINQLADNKGSVADLDAILTELKAKLADMPILAVVLGDLQPAIEKIGAANNDPGLVERVFGEFIALCSGSDNEMLKGAAEVLEGALNLKKLVGTDIAFEGIEVAPEKDKKFNSSELAGKYYLVDRWTTSDRGCFETIDELKELYGDFQPKGFEVVGINTDADLQMLSRVLEVFEMPWIVLSTKLSADAKLPEFPAAFAALPPGNRVLVGPDGKTLMVTDDLAKVRDLLAEKLGVPEKKEAPAEAAPATAPAESK